MRLAALLLLGLLSASAGFAQEPAEEPGNTVALHGFLLGLVSGRTTGETPPRGEGGDYVLGEERLRLDLTGAVEGATFLAKADLFHDAIAREDGIDVREGYAAYTAGPVDLRLGRLIATWGVGDLFFVNDVFPKDFDSFFSGRPMEYLKVGVDGAQVRFTSDAVSGELFVLPFFTPDKLPSAERFFFFDPFSAVPGRREERPESRYENTEAALRLYRLVAGFDGSLYVYRGFWHTPSVRLDDPVSPKVATEFFPKLSVYGASAQRTLGEGALSLEAGYYDSREDRDGQAPTIPNSQWRFLAGYQRQFGADFTAGVQFYGEVMARYGAYRDSLPVGSPRQDGFRGVASLRLTQFLSYQTWKLSLFAAYSPTDEDYFLQPEISYKLTDNLGVWVGANVFGGEKETTFFGQFDRSDNVNLGARFDF